jgi:hypothetical protein
MRPPEPAQHAGPAQPRATGQPGGSGQAGIPGQPAPSGQHGAPGQPAAPQAQPAAQPAAQPSAPASSNQKLLIAGLIAITVLAIALILFFVLTSGPTGAEDQAVRGGAG